MTPDTRPTGRHPGPADAGDVVTAWYGTSPVIARHPVAAAPVAGAHLPEGLVLAGRYRLGAPLGIGGFATVYQAWDLRLRRAVAIKVYPEHAGVMPRDEARVQATVQHPNLMPLYDHVADPIAAVTGLVMPLYPGCDLQQMIDAYGPLSFRRALSCLDQLCGAVDYLWQQRGLPHGDIKPANIWVTGSGAALLMDFNTVSLLARQPAGGIGTPGFTAPEVFHGAGDARSDVFSLGCVLFYCLAGELPYASVTAAEAGRHPPLPRLRPETQAPLAAVIHQAIHPDPRQRFATARELRSAVRAARWRGPSQLWRFAWDLLIACLLVCWAALRGAWRLLTRAVRHACHRPRQALAEGLILVVLGWVGWHYGMALWARHRLPIIIGMVLLLLLAVLHQLGRRRRWW